MKTLLTFALQIIAFSAISLNANNLNERIKALEAELQKAIKSTYLPSDEQIKRIKKEIDLLKLQQELEDIKRKQGITTQTPNQQTPQYYQSQRLQIQDSRILEANTNLAKKDSHYSGTQNGINRSGGFVGIGIGGGGANMTAEVSVSGDLAVKLDKTTNKLYNGGGVDFEIVAGYNQFFTQYLGLRYYVNANVAYMILELSEQLKMYYEALGDDWAYNTMKNMNALMINYGANVDFLGNFVVTEKVDFGRFVGVGIGGDSWIKGDKKMNLFSNFLPHFSFNVCLNVGLRANIAKHHGVEIAARVPFLKAKMLGMTMNATPATIKGKYFMANPYNITTRYVFNF